MHAPSSPRILSAMTIVALLLGTGFLASGPAMGASATRPLEDPHPAPFGWTNGVVALHFAGEEPTFWVSSVENAQVNVSVSALEVAEVDPTGQVVAVAGFSETDSFWALSWSNATGGGVEVNLTGLAPVAAASGTWNASEPAEGQGGTLGTSTIGLTFHLAPSTGASPWSIKFDVMAQSWPWRSPSDRLGVVLSVQAVSETDLASSTGTDGVTEGERSNGTQVASLTWGSTATVQYSSGSSATASVVSHVWVSDDHQSSEAALLFAGVSGGYTSLVYDPTVALDGGAFHTPAPLAWLFSPASLLAALVAGVVVAALAATAWQVRSHPAQEELAPSRPQLPVMGGLAKLLCRRCGAALAIPSGKGVRVLTCHSCGPG